ncbi:sensor histidine kinase [Actinomadura scrupuli]|uniref:sensor histidine kinase n=1 Tax=Actinomadura scrupuli TaxID=559629 RepID=UPI003D999776
MNAIAAGRLSLRSRLTLIYGSLFLVTGTVLVALMYAQTAQAMRNRFSIRIGGSRAAVTGTSSPLDPEMPLPSDLLALKNEVMRQIDEQNQAVLRELIQNSLLAMLALGLLAVVLGYIVAGRTLRPLHKVTATARRLSDSTLHERIGLDGPADEIKELADTFDAMLDRLHRAFDAQRRFVANASHELRTPLTINRTVLEVTLARRGTSEETRTLAHTLLGTNERHERLIEGLLLLARSERELAARVPVTLQDAVRSAVEQLEDLVEEAGVSVTAELAPAATTGDPVLLERCVVNLIENAVKYNVANGEVRIRTGRMGGAPVVRVENTGPVVAPYELDRIFEPFRRLRADRVGSARGAGLGLSIVRAVAQAHGGTVTAVPRPGGGLVVTVRLVPGGPPEPPGPRPPATEPRALPPALRRDHAISP